MTRGSSLKTTVPAEIGRVATKWRPLAGLVRTSKQGGPASGKEDSSRDFIVDDGPASKKE